MATIGGVKGRKRVEASSESQTATSSLLRAKDGSAFARWYPFPYSLSLSSVVEKRFLMLVKKTKRLCFIFLIYTSQLFLQRGISGL